MRRNRPSQDHEAIGLDSRRAALALIDAVLNKGTPLDQAATGLLKPVRLAEDRALALAIAAEVMRWLVDLDALIDSSTRQPLPHDAKARNVLRVMLAQALRLGTPPHAIIAASLPLLSGGPRRLAHGVFSALLKSDAALPANPTLPDHVITRWQTHYPLDGLAAGLGAPPPLDIALRGESADALPDGISLLPGHIRLERGSRVDDLPGFAEGAWWVQDLAAQLPARLLGKGDGRQVIDLCAAPGGKTMQLASAGWQVTALDRSLKRLSRMEANLARTALSATLVAGDALGWQPETPPDAILLDAPCSATGICRRHPDVLHRVYPPQIEELERLQTLLLDRAASWLQPGGQLVYAVCSLEPAEGEDQISALLARDPSLLLDPIHPDELPSGLAPAPKGWLRTHPGQLAEAGGLDGFFMVRLIKT